MLKETPSREETPVTTASGIPVPAAAGPEHVRAGVETRNGRAGEFPFARGVRREMYRERPWTIRQLAGFGTARDTNARYRLLLERGSNAINGVFDYPSLRAFDSDDEQACPDVGRGGVAVDAIDDFVDLFADIPLDRVSVSLVSSQPIGAVPHFAMFMRTAERCGIDPAALSGTSQNDFLMETAITIAPEALPPAGSFRLACDLAEFTMAHVPRWNPISVSGYNYREAGADAPLEMAMTLAHGQAVARELIRRGLAPEQVLPRISFFLSAHSDFFEEIAKYRAIRRMWAHWVRDELGVQDAASQRFRFHVQTSGVTNTARYAHVNIARTMVQGLSAVFGGTQSLHLNGYDEALSIPSEHAALTALRSQLALLHETGVTRSADPLGGSYLVEYLTDAIEDRARAVLGRIDSLGGIVAATERAWVHGELSRLAFAAQQAIDAGSQRIVGINVEAGDEETSVQPFDIPEDTLPRQRARLAAVRSRRNSAQVERALADVSAACRAQINVMPPVLAAIDAEATLGEIGRTFRDALGRWEFPLW
jgi:methylmalonyl-CoA mutase N-terminal domain/subunit